MAQDGAKSESHGKSSGKRPRVIKVDVDRIHQGLKEEFDEAGIPVPDSLDKKAIAAMFEDLGETIESVQGKRTNVVMVRVGRDSLDRLDDLVECGLTRSRSEAAAFLIGEGAKARKDLFEKIADQTRVIREAKERLKELLKDEELPRKANDATVIIAEGDPIKLR